MQVGFMMQKALGELFILKSTKPLPIIFKGTLWQQWKQHDRCNCHVSRSTLQKCISQSANNLLRVKKAVTQTSPETAQQYIKRAVHCMTWSHLQYYHTYSAVMLVLGHGPSVPNPSPWPRPRLCWSQPDGICIPWILGWKWHIFAHNTVAAADLAGLICCELLRWNNLPDPFQVWTVTDSTCYL